MKKMPASHLARRYSVPLSWFQGLITIAPDPSRKPLSTHIHIDTLCIRNLCVWQQTPLMLWEPTLWLTMRDTRRSTKAKRVQRAPIVSASAKADQKPRASRSLLTITPTPCSNSFSVGKPYLSHYCNNLDTMRKENGASRLLDADVPCRRRSEKASWRFLSDEARRGR